MSFPDAELPKLKPVLFFDLDAAEPEPIFENESKSFTKVAVTGGSIRSVDASFPFESKVIDGYDNISFSQAQPGIGSLDCVLYLDLGSGVKGLVSYGGVVRLEGTTLQVVSKEKSHMGFSDGYVTCRPKFDLDSKSSKESWVNRHNFIGKGRFIRTDKGGLKVQYYVYTFDE
ncbi:hypothetical protein OGAPHI_001735 [Ogataea philodendri]|uniref:Uncharacterized protein n=1 Tax=Ogataea philodendri TaxID=1378263 RepID=A0A9P8T6M6_9ASCO|nr:uncharacterized protein OGAPHI_001735 [Ogataea philodendri]KAH3667981.1 hypothetical protein OGAPHI_001735 [Ogataea philodendri]